MPPLLENPLPPCQLPTNCHRESRSFDRDPETLFADALDALRTLGGLTVGQPQEIERDPDRLGVHATFRVFVFTDDLRLRVEPHGDGAMLHVRSTSRVGRGDLGTNRRRVRTLFGALD